MVTCPTSNEKKTTTSPNDIHIFLQSTKSHCWTKKQNRNSVIFSSNTTYDHCEIVVACPLLYYFLPS